MVSSAPDTARCWPFMERSWVRNSFTSFCASISWRVSIGRESKARRDMGRARMLTVVVMLLFILSFSNLGALRWGSGLCSSKAARSFSRPSISWERAALASSWACFSASYFSTSSVTAVSSSWVLASAMACSSSASRVENSSSLARSASSSSFFLSRLRLSIKIFSMS